MFLKNNTHREDMFLQRLNNRKKLELKKKKLKKKKNVFLPILFIHI